MRIAPADSLLLGTGGSNGVVGILSRSPVRAVPNVDSKAPAGRIRWSPTVKDVRRRGTLSWRGITTETYNGPLPGLIAPWLRGEDYSLRIADESGAPPRLEAARDSVQEGLQRFVEAVDLPSFRAEAAASLGEALWDMEETAASYGYDDLSMAAMETRLVLLNESVDEFTLKNFERVRRAIVEIVVTRADKIDLSRFSRELCRGGLNWIPSLEKFGYCPDAADAGS
ncbi:MAG TPA: hypothetical protein VFJ58_23465 [Armatimonadota bacterium]|nr:hypothetical protein [Armatimonadota bacterium]